MDKADWLTICLIVNIAVFLGGLIYIARKREQKLARLANQTHERQLVPLCDDNGFEQPLWQGRIQAIIADDERHEAEMDLLVYPNSVFVGFVEDGFPFITLSAEQIQRVVGTKESVRILYRREDGRDIYYQLLGKQIRGVTEKIEFIRKRAHVRKADKN